LRKKQAAGQRFRPAQPGPAIESSGSDGDERLVVVGDESLGLSSAHPRPKSNRLRAAG
jgi:hypothetical protein